MDGQPGAPAASPVLGSEFETGREGFNGVAPVFQQDQDSLANNEGYIPFQPDFQPFALVLAGIGMGGQVYPEFIAAYFDGEAANIVGELVEGSAAFEVEAGVMPVAGEDAVFDRAAIQGKAHVGAAVVYGVDFVIVGEQGDNMAV
jgi:hypothetical protein